MFYKKKQKKNDVNVLFGPVMEKTNLEEKKIRSFTLRQGFMKPTGFYKS